MLRRGQGYYNKSNKTNAIYFVPGYDLLFHYPIEEVFLPLPQNIFPEVKDYYMISNYGRIWHKYLEDFLTINVDSKGYSYKPLALKDGRQKPYRIHRLVMLTFEYFTGCENLLVNHKDLNKLNNVITNLEWCTYSENLQHAYDNNAIDKNKLYRFRYGNDELIKSICKDIEDNILRDIDIAEKYNVPLTIIHNIKYGRSHTNISKNYNFKIDKSSNMSKGKARISIDKVYDICRYLEENKYPDINPGNTMEIHNYIVNLLNNVGLEVNNENIRRVQLIRRRESFKSISKDYKW